MVDLSRKATDGRLSFVKYVTENEKFPETKFEIEKGKSSVIFTKNGQATIAGTKVYTAGTKLKITDKNMHDVGGLRMAQVRIGSTSGYIPITVIRKPTRGNGTQYESEVVDAINAFIKEAGCPINIKLKGDTVVYKDILYAIKVDAAIKQKSGVTRDPKADIILCKDNKNPTGAGSIYISHKKEGGPEAFHQYSGVSELAGFKIYNHPLTQKFLALIVQAIDQAIENNTKLPYPVMGTFTDKNLSNMSIFGPEYGGAFSTQHTQIVGQGKVRFDRQLNGELYTMDFTSHIPSLSGNLSHLTGGYLPVFGAIVRTGRGFIYNGKRYDGVRVAIYPYKYMASRPNLKIFNL